MRKILSAIFHPPVVIAYEFTKALYRILIYDTWVAYTGMPGLRRKHSKEQLEKHGLNHPTTILVIGNIREQIPELFRQTRIMLRNWTDLVRFVLNERKG
jgi:hypothetical protein